MNTYAFAVQLEENSNFFEIFVITSIYVDMPNNIFIRWQNGFLNGDVSVIKNNIGTIKEGSFWNGNSLVDNESGNILNIDYIDGSRYGIILLSNNYVFGGANVSGVNVEKFEAALESKVIGIDITNTDANLGSIWDGTQFVN